MQTTVGEILINEALPKAMRDYNRTITGHNIGPILTELASKHPHAYANAVQKIKKIGDLASYESAHSVTLNDFKPDPVRNKVLREIETKAKQAAAKEKDPKKKIEAIVNVYDTMRPKLQDAVFEAGVKKGYGLHEMIIAKSRGNKNQLNNIVGAKTIIRDSLGKPIMTPINHSFSEGLDSHEYWADSYGTRKGVLATKIATAEGGYLGKRLSTPLMDMIVTEKDCLTRNGIIKNIDAPHLTDRFLAESAGNYSRGDVVTHTMLAKLQEKGIKTIKVRSPLTCEASKGVCARCFGLTYSGKLPAVGHPVGLQAAQTIAEPIAQSALSEKHSGGVSAKKELPVDFKVVKSFTEVPKNFPHGARLAEVSGKVSKIEKAPQGGSFVYVEDTKHYTPPDRDLVVKVGDDIDAGDALTDGWANPAEVVRLKGAGAGRKYFADTYEKINNVAYGTNSDSRHYEIYGRALVNHAVAEDIDEDNSVLPGDVVDLDYISKQVPDSINTKELTLQEARGKYFSNSVLHYMKGDLVDSKAISELSSAGISKIKVYTERPPITPIMQRISEVAASNPDWMARLSGEGLKRSLLKSVTKGERTNIHGYHPIPAIAMGTEFGNTGEHGEY